MATDTRADGAVLDELLGDVPARSTTMGVLSGGAMLDAADRLARRLLMDADGDDAAPLLRGWPSVARAAAALWRAVPAHRLPVTGGPEEHMDRLQVLADSILARLGSGWPGRGPSDPRLTHISELLTAVAELVERDADELCTRVPGGRGDRPDASDVARTRLMHVLYVTAHAVGVTLYRHGRDCHPDLPDAEQDPAGATLHPPYLVEPLAGWVQRLALCESVAGSYVNRHRRGCTTNTGTSQADPGRLHRVLTSWDIQAHRALAGDPTPTTIVLVTRAQALIASAGLVLINAAARANLLRSPVGAERLLGKIRCAGQAWGNLASRWSDLTTPGARVAPDLVGAAVELRATTRDLPHHKTARGPRDHIGTRQGLDRATTAILHALEAGAELAYVVSELADNPTLTGPARALSRRAQNDVAPNRGSGKRHAEDIVWVSPADILARRAVPLPPPVAEGLKAASATVIDAAGALCAATVATCAPPGRLRIPGPVQLDTPGPRPLHLPAIKPAQDASRLSRV